jgi:uncharacterized membrane protein YoaK (UPF0700 family)
MNKQVKAALIGVAVVWAVFIVCAAIAGLVCLCAAHPYIGCPIAFTVVGAFFGWLCENQESDSCD